MPISEDRAPEGLDLSDPMTKKVHDIITNEINAGLGAHGGAARLIAVKDNIVYLELQGGCIGCGMARMTLKHGIEARLKEAIPEIIEVVDLTDHSTASPGFC